MKKEMNPRVAIAVIAVILLIAIVMFVRKARTGKRAMPMGRIVTEDGATAEPEGRSQRGGGGQDNGGRGRRGR